MRILVVSYHCCIRVVKQSLALAKKGIDLHFIHMKIANPDFTYILPNQNFFDGTPESFSMRLALLSRMYKFDLIHVHNEPDWLGHIAKKVCPELPVVFDAHDLNSVRLGEAYPDEVKSFEDCDAFIFPSEGYQNLTCGNKLRLPILTHKDLTGKNVFGNHSERIKDKPTEVIFSYCNEEAIGMQDLGRVNGIVYQGGIGIADKNSNAPPYRDYTKLSLALTKMGIPFHIYGADTERTFPVANEYGRTGALIYTSLCYMTLLKQLSRYDWGLVGCAIDHPQWQNAMPNKLFEYLAAGIPVIVYNAAEAARFVERHSLGVVVENLDQIESIYNSHNTYRENVRAKRGMFTMESQVDKILALYEKLVGKIEYEEKEAV